MIFKKKAICDPNEISDSEIRQQFAELKTTANAWIKNKTADEQILILNYIIDILTEDICSGSAAKVLFNPCSSPFKECIPCFYINERGEKNTIFAGKKINIDLANAKLYVCPWNKTRILNNLLNLAEKPFVFDERNHLSDFYTDIGLCHVYNGNHSIHAGSYFKKGNIISNICCTELLYPHCSTDGLYWYNLHNEEKIDKVSDFRIASLYAIAQLRYNIKSSSNMSHLINKKTERIPINYEKS